MKKTLATLLVLAMATTFVACGNSDDIGGEIKNQNTETESQSAQDTSSEDNSTTDTSSEGATATLGTASGTVYESQFIGIGWAIPEDWIFATKEQMDQLNALVLDYVSDAMNVNLPEGSAVCDLYAFDAYGSNLNIQLEKLNAINAIMITEASYCELALGLLEDSYTSMGYTDITLEKTTVKVGDVEHSGISATCTYSGVKVYQKVAFIKQGEYMCVITSSSALEGTNDTVFSAFYSLEK